MACPPEGGKTAGPERGVAKGDRLGTIVELLLWELGVDRDDQHFAGTPARVAQAYREFTRGYRLRAAEILKTFRSRNRDLIVVSGIPFASLCPHHLLPYRGTVHFGYLPDGRIVGLSKIPRLVQGLAARLVVQEDLVADIADAFVAVVKPIGCIVEATARHDCVAARDARCAGAALTTMSLRGAFREQPSQVEAFHRIARRDGRDGRHGPPECPADAEGSDGSE